MIDLLPHLPIVHAIARDIDRKLPRHRDACASREDLASEGFLGLMQAAAAFDPGRGVRFETFAFTRVRGAIIDYLRGLAHARDFTTRGPVRSWLDGEPTLACNRPGPAQTAEARDGLNHWLSQLSERQRRVVEMLMDGMAGTEIAGKIGCTPPRVSHLKKQAASKWHG